ncbi:hypothetical protein IWW49_001298 [Coemansia sp. RSA 1797]|nr:hypothetical protein IWW49_001298 [Coemansia sp. RSA 1797]
MVQETVLHETPVPRLQHTWVATKAVTGLVNDPSEPTAAPISQISIKRIQQSISKAYAQIDQVKQAHEETLNTTGDFRLSQSTARRDDQISHTQSMMSQVNSEMRALRELKNQYMSSHSVANSQKALLQSRYQKVGRDVKALLTAYSKVSKDYSTQYREKLKKQYRIANPSATEEEVDEAVYNDDAHQAFAQAVSNSSRVQNATRVLSSVKQRHDDVKKIAKTIEELAALIQELSELVDEQQVQLDSIEDAVEASNTHVQSAQVAIGEGIVLAKKTRKCKWWFILAALILAIVIGVVLYLKLRPN